MINNLLAFGLAHIVGVAMDGSTLMVSVLLA